MKDTFQKTVGTQVITKDDMRGMIEYYNSIVDDFLELGIGKHPYIDENAEITVEELMFFQSIMISKMQHYIKNIKGGQEV